MKLIRVLAILALGPAACQPLDTSQPIYLVPESAWDTNQTKTLSMAAGLWNAEVGTRLSVSREPPSGSQQVPVIWSDLVCAYSDGITTFPDIRIGICSIHSTPLNLLRISRHEIGHVLGIHTHADDPLAVMAPTPSRDGVHFQKEDREFFSDANPDHVDRRGACGILHDIARSPNRPMMVQASGASPAVIWAADGALRYALLDATARPAGASKKIPTQGTASWIRASPVKDGFVVTWDQQGYRYASRVSLPAGSAGPAIRLGLSPVSEDDRRHMSQAVIGDDIFVTVIDQSNKWRITRLDLVSGKPGAFTSPVTDGRCALAGDDNGLLAACEESGYSAGGSYYSMIHITRLSPAGVILDRLDLGSATKYTYGTLQLFVGSNRAHVAFSRSDSGLTVHRVDTAGSLTLAKSRNLPLPGDEWRNPSIAIRAWAGELILAATCARTMKADWTTYIFHEEVHVTSVDPLTLHTRRGWESASPEGVTTSIQPQLGVAGGRLVIMWRDQHGDTDLIRSRCLR